MKRQIFFFIGLFIIVSQNVNGQTQQNINKILQEHLTEQKKKEMYKEFLDLFCEQHFEDCFYWKYYEILEIEDVDKTPYNKVEVSGRVKNGSFFGMPVIREFIAEIKFYDEKVVVYFKKNGDAGWSDCKHSFLRNAK